MLTNNDTLRRLRYALRMNDPELEEIFQLIDSPLEREAIADLLKKETDVGFRPCTDSLLGAFLDGLILKRRGRKEGAETKAKTKSGPLTNNDVLKKLRIALELKEDDFLAIMKNAGVELSPSELTALFRQKGHKNYKECGDQFLRNFLTGLTGHPLANPKSE